MFVGMVAQMWSPAHSQTDIGQNELLSLVMKTAPLDFHGFQMLPNPKTLDNNDMDD